MFGCCEDTPQPQAPGTYRVLIETPPDGMLATLFTQGAAKEIWRKMKTHMSNVVFPQAPDMFTTYEVLLYYYPETDTVVQHTNRTNYRFLWEPPGSSGLYNIVGYRSPVGVNKWWVAAARTLFSVPYNPPLPGYGGSPPGCLIEYEAGSFRCLRPRITESDAESFSSDPDTGLIRYNWRFDLLSDRMIVESNGADPEHVNWALVADDGFSRAHQLKQGIYYPNELHAIPVGAPPCCDLTPLAP